MRAVESAAAGIDDVALGALLVEHLGDALVGLGLDEAEREILDLPFDLPDAEPVGERGEDVDRFLGNALLLVRARVAESAHVVQAVGQFDEHHPHVLAHRQKRFAQGLAGEGGAAAGFVHQRFSGRPPVIF